MTVAQEAQQEPNLSLVALDKSTWEIIKFGACF